MKHLDNSPNQTARRFFRTNAVVSVIRNCWIGIRISLTIFRHCLRVAGLNTWARIAAIFIQILEWHGGIDLWCVTGRDSDCARAITGTVVNNILNSSGANPSVRVQILQSVMHNTDSEVLRWHIRWYIISSKLKSVIMQLQKIVQSLCKVIMQNLGKHWFYGTKRGT